MGGVDAERKETAGNALCGDWREVDGAIVVCGVDVVGDCEGEVLRVIKSVLHISTERKRRTKEGWFSSMENTLFCTLADEDLAERRGEERRTHGSSEVLLHVMLVVPPDVGLVGVLIVSARVQAAARARDRLKVGNLSSDS
jgi:hypothetical protein